MTVKDSVENTGWRLLLFVAIAPFVAVAFDIIYILWWSAERLIKFIGRLT